VPAADLGGRKARLLLKLLAVERGRTVPADRITGVLWGDSPPASPAGNVATLVSRLRRVLGDGVIQGGRSGYRLGAAPAVRVDLDEASRWAVEAARRLAAAEPALAVTAASRAHDLLGPGLVLEDEPDAGWAQPARAEQASQLREVRLLLAEAWLGTGALAEAGTVAAAAVSADPYDERSRRVLMRARAAAGESARALASYAELRELLAAELGTDPAPETQDLHLAILREGEPRAAGRAPRRGPGAGPGPGDGADPGPGPGRGAGSARGAGVIPGLGTGTVAVTPGGPVAVSAGSGWAAAGTAGSRAAAGTGRPGGAAGLVTGTGGRGDPGGPAGPGGVWPALPGRVAEMARLRELWTAANSGVPALTLICGEAGIGKTRLADELARAVTAAGGTVLAARCYETERSLFLQPIADAIAVAVRSIRPARMQDLAGQHGSPLARLVPEVAALLGPLPGQAGLPGPGPAVHQENAELERRRTFEAVTAFVLAAAEHAPVLLSLDDLQNAGRATAELLHYLIRQARRGRLLVVATVRAEEGAGIIDSLAPVSTRIDLGALPAAAVADLAAEAGLPGQAEAVSQRTRGHTLFVVETLRALAAGTTGIPESLEAAVLARVRRAGPPVEAALRAASVLGASFDPATLAGLLGESPHAVVGTCTAAENARLLVVTERDYEFANDLVQEVLYATTPGPARMAYHRQAADLLTSRPEAMAGHAAAAGDWARAARGWRLAGEQALARAAVADAAELLTQSVDAADRAGDPEDQARSLLARGRALEMQAGYAAAVRDITAAIAAARGAGDLRMEMTGLIALGGDAPVALGQPIPDAIATIERGLSLASALSDRAAEALLRARLAIYAVNGLRFSDALEQGGLAIRAARASGSEVALAAAFDGYKTAVAYVGDIDALVPVIEELEPMLRRQGDLLRLHWTTFESAFPALAAGDWPAALARIEDSLVIARQIGTMAHASWHLATVGGIARLQGRLDDALAIGREALEASALHAWSLPVAGAELGITLLEAGERDEAIAVLEGTLATADQDGAEARRLRCLAPLAEATGSREVLGQATALLESITAPPGHAWLTADGCYLAIARAWLAHGDPVRARAVLTPLLTAAARVPWVAPLAAASLIDAQAALAQDRPGEAAPQLRRAAGLASRHGLPAIAAQAASGLEQLSRHR
jgi:DNA-binding SARP family transcriptional activator